jgi:hypothetical protein
LFWTDHFPDESDPTQCVRSAQVRLTAEKIWGLIHAPFFSCLKTKKPDHLIFKATRLFDFAVGRQLLAHSNLIESLALISQKPLVFRFHRAR